MSGRVHDPGIAAVLPTRFDLARVGKACFFADREGVHVTADQDGRSGTVAQDARDPMPTDPGDHLVPGCDECVRYQGGGLHLFEADDETLAWTAGEIARLGVENLMGGHCTGIEAVYRLRELVGLRRETAVVASVGASFTPASGIDPLGLAR